MNTLTDHPRRDARSLPRRRVYLGEGLSFEIESATRGCEAEAIDLTHEGLGVAVLLATDVMMPAVGEVVTVRYTGRGGLRRSAAGGGAPRRQPADRPGNAPAARALAGPRDDAGWPTSIGARASATRVRRRWRRSRPRRAHGSSARPCTSASSQVGAGGMTLRTTQPHPPLPPRAELDFELHLASIAHERGRARLTSVRRDEANGGLEVGVAWVDPPRELLSALSRYLLAGDAHADARGAARRRPPGQGRRAGGHLRLRQLGAPTSTRSSPCACTPIRPRGTSTARRSPTCARPSTPTRAISPAASAGGSSATLRVIFVDGDPARSQYVSLGGHEVPQWLWDAGFVEGGAGATHPDFQRAGLYVPLMQHLFRVAVQSGHRYVLGACPDELSGCTATWASTCSRPGSSSPSPDGASARTCSTPTPSGCCATSPRRATVAAMASAIAFAGLPVAA